jgi:Holliday junction resolvase RusA-like endonuclease
MTIKGEPSRATHQGALRVIRTKSGRTFVGKYASSKAKRWASVLAGEFARYKPEKPLEGPLHVEIIWVFGYPKSTPKKHLGEVRWKTTRPDLDNMEKTVLDVLTEQGFMHDDSQIALKATRKLHGPNPAIIVGIAQLDPIDTHSRISVLQQ